MIVNTIKYKPRGESVFTRAASCNVTAARLSEQGECISIPADLSSVAGIAALVEAIYLASKASSYVTGVVIPVDGGVIGAAGTL
jgi:NAD(P)-dependent dehydrogenase (short-subunit alcohol dehydrogenase family)